MMMVGDPRWPSDYAVELDYDSGQAIKIFVRAQDTQNAIVLLVPNQRQIYLDNSELRILKDGSEKLLVNGDDVSRGQHKARLEANGEFYAAYIDNQKVLSINDPTFKNGKVGFAVFCESNSNCPTVASFKVTALD